MSLVKCFNLAKIDRIERVEINASILSLTEMGMEQKAAARKVVKDLLKETEAERNNIVEFILKSQPEPEIEITGKKDKTIKVDLPKKEADALTPKEQKKYLIDEIDVAIEKELKATGWEGGIEKVAEISKSVNVLAESEAMYEFHVPGDGSFTILGKSLFEFKKQITKTFPATIVSKKFKPSTAGRVQSEKKKYAKLLGKDPKDIKPSEIDGLFANAANEEMKGRLYNFNDFQNWLLSQDISKATRTKIKSVASKAYIAEAHEREELSEIERVVKKLVEWKKGEHLTDPEGFTKYWTNLSAQGMERTIKELVDLGELPISYSRRKISDTGKTVTASEILDGLTRKSAIDKFKKPEIEITGKKDKAVKVDISKKEEQYSTKTTLKDSGISLEELQKLFEHQKVNMLPDGSVSVKTALGKGFVIKFVETIAPDKAAFHVGYGRAKGSGELIAGKYKDGVVTISKVGDIWTVAHEYLGHALEDAGFINKNDQKALSGEIKRRAKKGTWETLNKDDIGGKEDRAEFIAQELKERSHSRPAVQRVLQKIQDFIDALVNLYKRTARGVIRDISSGKIYEKEGTPEIKQKALREGMPMFAVKEKSEQYSVKPPKNEEWAKSFLKKHGVEPLKRAVKETKPEGEAKKTEASYQETLEPVTINDYTENRETSKNIKITAKTNAKRIAAEITEGVDKFLGSISTRLGQASPKLKAKLRKLDFDIGTKNAESVKTVQPLLEKAKKMSRDDFADWDYARKNSDSKKIHELIDKYDMEKEYAAYRNTLDALKQEGLDVGLEIGEIEDYAPRILKDPRGFLTAIGKEPEWPVYSRQLQERASEIGITVAEMDSDMKAEVISNMILGGWVGLGGIPATKQRKLKKIPARLNKYYMNSDAALMQHLHGMRKGIEARKFFGKIPAKVAEMRKRLRVAQGKIRKINDSLKTEKVQSEIDGLEKQRNKQIGFEKQYTAYIAKYALQRDYTENIGTYVIELIENKEISAHHERVVNEILNARFHEAGTRGLIQAYKNLSYIDTMGSPVSALTQIGDLAWSAYEGGLIRSLKNAYKALKGKSRITKEDIGIERIAQEFADPGTLSNAVSFVFKVVGLEKIDSIGKESLLNTAFEKYQKQAKTNPVQLKQQIKPIFEGETDSVIDDLVNDEVSENVKLLVYSRLLDFQPVALSEMPQKYLDAGNGRLFYMLKTFTIKVFDVYRNEIYYKVKKGNTSEKIQGLKNMVRLSFYFVLANAGADELKDWVLGRKTDFSDRMVDNLLRLMGISKFVTWKARTEGVGSALSRQILPPFKFIDSLGKDIITAGDEKGLEVVGSIPVVGKLAYWHMGRGVSKRGDLWDRRLRKRKAKLNEVQDRLEKSKDKKTFRREHKNEILELRQINRLQGRLNDYRKRINRLKSKEETAIRKKQIQRLEDKRTSLIKEFLGEKTEARDRLSDFTKEYVNIRNSGKSLNELKKSIAEYNRKQTAAGKRTIPWSSIVKKGNRIRKAGAK